MKELKRFQNENLNDETVKELKDKSRKSRGDILTMTTLASSGHPGGSMSSVDILTLIYNTFDKTTDDFVISCGHISPGVFSSLGRAGFLNVDEAIAGFRKAGTKYTGHVEKIVDGVAWDTGNLGQGISVAAGFAYAKKLKKNDGKVFCLMGDGEQQKGQQAEARDLAAKLKLDNLVCYVDRNYKQISGNTDEVMLQNIEALYKAADWTVLSCDAHDYNDIYAKTREALLSDKPAVIIANSHMGHGVSFMEDEHKYHGAPLKEDQLETALKELEVENRLSWYKEEREKIKIKKAEHGIEYESMKIDTGTPREYTPGDKVALRDSYGNALCDLAKINNANEPKVLCVDCDLAGSTKLNIMQKEVGTGYIQTGIQEHNASTFAGALTHEGYTVFISTFGVFGLCECYNQQRLNELNHTRLNLVLTHCGIDVGEDGKTHQGIDYVGVTRNFFNFEAILPADANQMDRAVRYAAGREENVFIGAGRSKYTVLTKEDGSSAFGETYNFVYGKDEIIREGQDGAIIALGHMASFALEAHEILKKEGIRIAVVCKSCPKEIDEAVMNKILKLPYIFTLEDHSVNTGIGSVISEYIAGTQARPVITKMGVTEYGASGAAKDLYKLFGLDGESVAERIRKRLNGDK